LWRFLERAETFFFLVFYFLVCNLYSLDWHLNFDPSYYSSLTRGVLVLVQKYNKLDTSNTEYWLNRSSLKKQFCYWIFFLRVFSSL
jgi:hypothetical protein